MFSIRKAIAYAYLAVVTVQAAALDFTNSEWIWTNEISSAGSNAPVGHRAFRKTLTAPSGQTLLSATILITTDNGYTLYANGAQLGTSDNFEQAQSYCVALNSQTSVIAIDAVNDGTTANPAGLLVAIQVTYTDGSTSTAASDSSWKYSLALTTNFQQTSFDDSAWPTAAVQGSYGTSPWGTIDIPPASPDLSFAGASWIWTNEGSNSYPPVGPRVFRFTYTAPAGQVATFANVLITADNEFYLYANGNFAGTGANWGNPQRFIVPISPSTSKVVFVIYAFNILIGPAGVIAAIEINTNAYNCAIKTVISTNTGWKTNLAVPNGFELPGFDDSSWQAATSVGAYGVGPWGTLTLPPS